MENWFFKFPDLIRLDFADSIDSFVRYLNVNYSSFFDLLKSFLNTFILFIYQVLQFVPWWALIIFTSLACGPTRWKICTGRASIAPWGFMKRILKFARR